PGGRGGEVGPSRWVVPAACAARAAGRLRCADRKRGADPRAHPLRRLGLDALLDRARGGVQREHGAATPSAGAAAATWTRDAASPCHTGRSAGGGESAE